MHLCIFEDEHVPALRPLVETRAAYDLRLGIRSLLETTRDAFAPDELALHTRPLVASVTKQAHEETLVNRLPDGVDVLFVNGRFVANEGAGFSQIRDHVRAAEPRTFTHDGTLVAAWVPGDQAHMPPDLLSSPALPLEPFSDMPTTSLEDGTLLRRPWDLLDVLRPALHRDAAAWTGEQSSSPSLSDRPHTSVHESVIVEHPDNVHLGSGATVRPGAVLNAEEGPIVIDTDATVFERAVVKGPCYVGPKTQIKVGANIEGAAFGYWCKVGGEVHDTVMHSLSNKAHPGFLGHAYLGRWCNLGADTNNSNLRNDYGKISAYAPADETFVSTGRQFAGLFMGDHSKCGINSMFNTGTVVGTFCNLYGGDFLPQYVPPFSWGGPSTGFTTFRLQKAFAVAERVMDRRNTPFTPADRALLSSLFERTADERARHHA